MRRVRWSVGLLVLSVRLSLAQEPPLPVQHQFDVTQKLLERTTQDHEQCKRDWADLWVQARQISLAYQQLRQELEKMKQEALPQAAPPRAEEPPSAPGTTP
jgi:hypothetical protein